MRRNRPTAGRRYRPCIEPLERRDLLDAGTLRIVTYNIEADINGVTTPRPGLYEVLEGIGEEQVQGTVLPLDILALQETTSNSTTVAPIVSALNSYYSGMAVFDQSPYQATQNGSNSFGNGPNALVYNTSTLTLLASVGVGTPKGSTNGEYRQVVRYQFQAVGYLASVGVFYMYVSHAKAGTTSSDFTARNEEAQIIRNDEATLPASARVLYVGDLNTTSSGDASYQTLIATNSPGGAAQGAGFDPINRPGNWDLNASFQDIMTESSTDLRYRDDHELPTQNIMQDTAGGLGYLAGSHHTFGVNGSTPVHGSVNNGSDSALNSDLVQDGPTFIPASTLYADLTTASDHLPVVADYRIIRAATATALGSAPSPSVAGQTVTFTATVSSAAGTPTGTVIFMDGTTTLGTTTLDNSGVAAFTTAGLAVGTHTITAVYSGDTSFSGSTSSQLNQAVYTPLAVAETVNGANVTIAGQSVSLAGLQRSMVDNIVLTFSRPVALDAAALALSLHANVTVNGTSYADGYGTVPETVSASNPSGDGLTWVVSFGGASVVGQSIADGIYDITLTGSAVHDTAVGQTYAQEAAVSGAAQNVTNTFYRLFADTSGHETVNTADGRAFGRAFNSNLGDTAYLAYLDANADGTINTTDARAFGLRFNTTFSGFTPTI
jgi:endonuclease/exonuclease/phosphatase family metal-dependent hydrolase